jgi:hypothetical protein
MNSLNDEILNKSSDLDYNYNLNHSMRNILMRLKPRQYIDYSYGNGNHLFLSHLKDFIFLKLINLR